MAQAKEKGESLTLKEAAGKWKKATEKAKEKYEDYAKELKDEIDKNRDMIELTFNLKPSRPKTGFNYFQKECYDSGDVKGFGKTAEIKDKWDKLSEEEKEKYLRMGKRESLIYIIKKRNYDAMIRKDLGKAPSAMNLFYADEAKKNSGLKLADMYSKWKNADNAVKKKYQNKAKDAKEEFQKKLEEFKNRVYDKPKRALTAYNFFYKHEYQNLRKDNQDLSVKEMLKLMRGTWDKMTEKQTKIYDEMSEQDYLDKKEYGRQYEANGYYIIKESAKKKRKTNKKKESVEEGDKTSSKKSKKFTRTPNKENKKSKKV